MSIKGQGLSLNLAIDHSDFIRITCFSQKLSGIWNLISCESYWENGNENLYKRVSSHGQDSHRAHVWQKPLKSPEPTDRWFKIWYVASGIQVLPILFKWWPWDDLDLLTGRVKYRRMLIHKTTKKVLKIFAKILLHYLWLQDIKIIFHL